MTELPPLPSILALPLAPKTEETFLRPTQMDQSADCQNISYHSCSLEGKVRELELALEASRHREAALIVENNLLRIHIELLATQSDDLPAQSEEEEISYASDSFEKKSSLTAVEPDVVSLLPRANKKPAAKRKLEDDEAEFVVSAVSRHERRGGGVRPKKNSTGTENTCHECGTTDTPGWRRGPDGPHTLCNACGLRFASSLKKDKRRNHYSDYYD